MNFRDSCQCNIALVSTVSKMLLLSLHKHIKRSSTYSSCFSIPDTLDSDHTSGYLSVIVSCFFEVGGNTQQRMPDAERVFRGFQQYTTVSLSINIVKVGQSCLFFLLYISRVQRQSPYILYTLEQKPSSGNEVQSTNSTKNPRRLVRE
jgi:hypothetical protein